MNHKLKRLIRQLGEAIHETVSESEDIAGVVKNIREEGFDVLLMLEATIGLNQAEGAEKPADGSGAEAVDSEGPFNANDLNFLRSLRITVEEEADAATKSAEAMPQEHGADENPASTA